MTADLIKLIRTYRVSGITERLRLSEEIFARITPDLRNFIFTKVKPDAAEDVLQEVLKGVATGLGDFKGGTEKEFWSWCYSIARNKKNDQLRRQINDRLLPLPEEELWQLVEASAESAPLAAEGRMDLEYAMNLLTRSNPKCRDYLWEHYIIGLTFREIATEESVDYDTMRMRVGRCLEEVRELVA